MDSEGCTPLEVLEVLKLRDYNLAVRCLEVIRSLLLSIQPDGFRHRIEVIPLCHHHAANCYPAFGVFGAGQGAEVDAADARINAWAAERGLDWLVAESRSVAAPSWTDIRAKQRQAEPAAAPDPAT
ncbi:hypothetical protein FTUN_4547 [Frigoriglobus tundricola]|uniref:Uncharacterized protein n=1 Tax=Frigoriglobus tundricola TaxID=2774151 RepID=A0A6M5YSD5_9BACT|nr:hypothetical protein FTUN_4547 [Frigoriglobus tundricola]